MRRRAALARAGLFAAAAAALGAGPSAALASGLVVQVDARIPVAKFEIVRKKIAPLSRVNADIVRYFEVKQGFIFLRLEDRKYCFGDRCLTFVVNGSLSSYAAIHATGTVFLAPQSVRIGSDSPQSDSGVVAGFQASSSDESKNIKVFISNKLVAVLP